MPFLIMFDKHEDGFKAGRFLRASDLGMESENNEWKPVVFDKESSQIIVPNGTMGQRWEEGKQWNLKLENEDGSKIDPALTVADDEHEIKIMKFPYFDNAGNSIFERPIAARKVTLANGETTYVATVFDLMTSQYLSLIHI